MPSFLTRVMLFLCSYFPLCVIIAVVFFRRSYWLSLSVLLAGLLGLLGSLIYLRLAKSFAAVRISVKGHQRKDAETMSYILTYLVPFVVVPSDDWEKLVSLAIFFVVLGLLYINTNMIHINPMLNIFGYRIYELSQDDGAVHALITKRRVMRGSEIDVIEIDEDIYLEKS
jgi:phosphatidylglycerophosphate synthase